MVVRGRGTPAGRDETPHSTGSLLAPPSRPERTRHPGTVVAFRIDVYRTMCGRAEAGAAARIGPPAGAAARTPERARIAPGSMAGSTKPESYGSDLASKLHVGIAGSPFRLALVARRHGESGRTH